MTYQLGDTGLLDFSSCATEEDKVKQCWDFFNSNLVNAEIRAFDGKLVRGFTKRTFSHIISGSSNKYDPALGHDIHFVEQRASHLPLIGKVVSGEIVAQCWRVSKGNGKKRSVRRILTVIETDLEYYVVVLDEVGDTYRLRTAFPASKGYYDRCIRGQGTNAGTWG